VSCLCQCSWPRPCPLSTPTITCLDVIKKVTWNPLLNFIRNGSATAVSYPFFKCNAIVTGYCNMQWVTQRSIALLLPPTTNVWVFVYTVSIYVCTVDWYIYRSMETFFENDISPFLSAAPPSPLNCYMRTSTKGKTIHLLYKTTYSHLPFIIQRPYSIDFPHSNAPLIVSQEKMIRDRSVKCNNHRWAVN
jgi:hypothetical protein